MCGGVFVSILSVLGVFVFKTPNICCCLCFNQAFRSPKYALKASVCMKFQQIKEEISRNKINFTQCYVVFSYNLFSLKM